MGKIPGVRRLFRFPWRTRRGVEADFDEEVRFHLELRTRELVERRGMDPDSARVEALRQFGDGSARTGDTSGWTACDRTSSARSAASGAARASPPS